MRPAALRLGLATALVSLVSMLSFGADDKPAKVDEPLVGMGFQLKVGYFWKTKDQQPYYDFSYKGATIFTRGSAPTPTTIGGDPIDFGDQPLNFSIEKGFTTIGGSLFQSQNVTPIKLRNGLGDRFRFAAGIDTQFEKDKQTTVHAGFEYSPKLGPLPLFDKKSRVRTGGETFLAFGVNAEHRSDPASTTSDMVAAIYRGRVGFGFDCAISQRKLETLQRYLEIAKAVTPKTLADFVRNLFDQRNNPDLQADDTFNLVGLLGLPMFDKAHIDLVRVHNTRTATDRQKAIDDICSAIAKVDDKIKQAVIDEFVASLKDPLGELQDAIENPDKDTSQKLRDKLSRNQPRMAVYAEFEGSYSLSKEVFDRRYRSIYSGNVRYYFDSYRPDNGYLTLRYENGFSRAEPNLRTNMLVLEFGIRF